MRNPFKKAADSAAISAEMKRLEERKAETERRRAEVLQSLEEARQGRRAVLDADASAIDAASAKVRTLNAEAIDLSELLEELEAAIHGASERFRAAADAERRSAAAVELEKISQKVESLSAELEKAVAAVSKSARAMIAAIPPELGIASGYHGARPEGRNETEQFSGREMVAAAVADALAAVCPELFDTFSDRGYRRGLFCLTDKSNSPSFKSNEKPAEPLAASDAVANLIATRLRSKARAILDGEQEPSLGGVGYRQERQAPKRTIVLMAVKNVEFLNDHTLVPSVRQYLAGATESFIEAHARKLVGSGAFVLADSPEAQQLQAERAKPKHRLIQNANGDYGHFTNLGDPLGLRSAEAEEAARAVA